MRRAGPPRRRRAAAAPGRGRRGPGAHGRGAGAEPEPGPELLGRAEAALDAAQRALDAARGRSATPAPAFLALPRQAAPGPEPEAPPAPGHGPPGVADPEKADPPRGLRAAPPAFEAAPAAGSPAEPAPGPAPAEPPAAEFAFPAFPAAAERRPRPVRVREAAPAGALDLRFESEAEAEAAPAPAALPPLQSVVELTTAARPPAQTAAAEAAASAEAGPVAADVVREDGRGALADGTTYERTSGEERGPEGFWKRWTRVEGSSHDGAVRWTEVWWEASDWNGLKELGAEKTGRTAGGAAWREAWTEKLYLEGAALEPAVSRTAHKWAQAEADGEAWEEEWRETYLEGGLTHKTASKWGRQGAAAWQERWGEEYDGGGGCVKWTDRWTEEASAHGSNKWGDKWEEIFKDGAGRKHGETWSDNHGDVFSKKWGEEHLGQGRVHKWGSSNHGEHWDVTEQSGTHYNPVPHFGFAHAVAHSHELHRVAVLPEEEEAGPDPEAAADGGLGPGLGLL